MRSIRETHVLDMSLRKSATLGSLFSNCPQSICYSHSSSQPRSRATTSNKIKRREARQAFATIAHDPGSPQPDDQLHWPRVAEARRIPTPYQIFNQSRAEPYSKRRFYELVKIYHPDRNTCSNDEALSKTHLERYRLIIAANTILSDPEKRSAYDRNGYGWSDFLEEESGKATKSYKYTTYHRWKSETVHRFGWSIDDDPMYNATWEDWERWYERQRRPPTSPWNSSFFSAGQPPQTLYASNFMFLTVVALLATLGGIGQATRANQTSRGRSERIQAHSEKVSRNLMAARDDAMESAGTETKGDRIKRWVRERDDYAEGEPDGRILRTDDDGLCASGIVTDKDELPFWKKPPEPWERGDLEPYRED